MADTERYNYIINFIKDVRQSTKAGNIKWEEMTLSVLSAIKLVITDNIETGYIETYNGSNNSRIFIVKTSKTGNEKYRFGFFKNSDSKVIQAPKEIFYDVNRLSELVSLYQVVEIQVYKTRILELEEELHEFDRSLGKLVPSDNK